MLAGAHTGNGITWVTGNYQYRDVCLFWVILECDLMAEDELICACMMKGKVGREGG